MMNKPLLTVLFALAFSAAVWAQNRTVSGKVTGSDDGLPLPQVSVLLKGTTTGVPTNIDGEYRISIPSEGGTLVFSFLGYATQEVEIGNRTVIDVVLVPDITALEEVVVTGYSTDSRRETTGSVSTVQPRALTVSPSGNVEQQLQGRIAGVTVISNGQPGTASQVRVRGFGALGGNQPLYIVDGVAVETTDFLSPDDIESTTVLKDATAASIYGARAAGGVIVYTTKRGRKNRKMEVDYNGMYGLTTPGSGFNMMNPGDHAAWTWNAIRNEAKSRGAKPVFNHPQFGSGDKPVIPDYLLVGADAGVRGNVNIEDHRAKYNIDGRQGALYQVIKANKEGTDWYKAITRTALLQRHHVGLRGGGESSRYYFGLGVQEQEGILKGQKFSRYTFRANSEFDLSDKIRLGESIQATYRAARLLQGDANGAGSSDDENMMFFAQRMPTIIPTHDVFGGYAGTIAPGFNNPQNPLATIERQADNRAFQSSAFGNVYLEVEPVENLVFRTSFGGRFLNYNVWSYSGRTHENSENKTSFNFTQSQGFNTQWIWTNTVNYKKALGGSKIDVLLGQESLNFNSGRGMSGTGINPFSESPDYVNLSNINTPVLNGGHSNGINFASYFSRLNYTFEDKYMASVVVRRDGSSRFGSKNRYGVFPAFSVGWRISEEPFLQGVDWLDDLKIRGGYGIVGNSNNVDPNNQFNLYGTTIGGTSYDIRGTNTSAVPGYARTRIGNPSARWERAITQNIGIDLLAFDNKLDFIVDLWQKDTEDLLFRQPVTVQRGHTSRAPFVNVGKMRNRGIDLRIVNKGKLNNEWNYQLTYNMGLLENEIVQLSEGLKSLPGRSSEYRGITPVLNQVGRPLSSFYGYEVQGLFADADEVKNAATQEGAAPGRFRFRDINGDGKIDTQDRTWLGSPVPKVTGGLTVRLEYKGFEFEAYSFYSLGNKIYNMNKLFTDFYSLFPGSAISERVKKSWTPNNKGAKIPIFENVSNFSTNTQSNSFYVEDGSYFRMQNITLTYNLPESVLSSLSMSKLKVFAGVNNVFTITGYEGLDPSVGGAADTNFGVDLGNFPITRSWTLGISAGF